MEGEALRLIGLIYDAAMGAVGWPCLLQEIATSMNAHSAILRMQDYEERLVGIFESVGMDEGYKSAYQKHFINLDLYRPFLESLPVGSIASTTPLLPLSVRRKTEFFNDYALPQDKIYISGGLLARDSHFQLQFGVHRGMAAGDFEQRDLMLLNLLAPHLVRAVGLRHLMDEVSVQRGMTEAALDRLRIGVIFTDGVGKPFYLNREAEALMMAGCGLLVGQDGLTMRNPADTARLRKLIATASQTTSGTGMGAGGTMRGATATWGKTLQLQVVPLSRQHVPQCFSAPAACAAAFISLPGQLSLPWREVVALYGLTPAEAKLAVALADGLSLEEVVARLAISIHTARNQLKAVFAKTDTRRQSELLSLLLTSVFALCKRIGNPTALVEVSVIGASLST